MTDEEIRYPTGRFDWKEPIDDEKLQNYIFEIEELPNELRDAVGGLDDEQLDTPYRKGGWTIRKVVHHIPDSHMNAYIRFKLALTEDNPRVKTYHENLWAELADSQAPIDVSLSLTEALHFRWSLLLRSMSPEDFDRTFQHPDWGDIPIRKIVHLYAWHGKHHAGHILSLRERMAWY